MHACDEWHSWIIFFSLTETLTCNSIIGLNNDGGVAMVRNNGDFDSIRLHDLHKDVGKNVCVKTLKHFLTFI